MNYQNPELRERLAAEYALGTLRGAARRRFQRLMEDDIVLRQLVEGWELRLNNLAEQAPLVPPPARLWQNIEQRLGPAPAVLRSDRRGLWQSLAFWRLTTLASAAAAAALALFALLQPPPEPHFIAVLVDESRKPILSARFDPADRRLVIRSLQPPVADPAHSHEAWLVEGDVAPRSLGLLAGQDTVIELSADEAEDMTRAILAISLEPAGGSPTGSPTQVLYLGVVVPAVATVP